MIDDDGYSDTAENIMGNYPDYFLADAYKKGNKIILALNLN